MTDLNQDTPQQTSWAARLRHAVPLLAWIAGLAMASSFPALCQDSIQVPEGQARSAAVSKPEPPYSPIAKQMRVAGKVTIEVVIDPDGKVQDCQAISGNAILTAPAVATVRKWTFKPFTEGGKPVRATTRLNFTFGS